MRDWKKMAAMAVSVLALSETARAQSPQQTPQPPQPAVEPDKAVQKFEPSFFARFSPVTAEDMVRQLPGFTLDEGEDLRGFGATAGNVLIDGQRPSSKTSIKDELGRISAADVLRIELIGAAAAGDIDVRGYTELANVVLKPATKMQESTTWAATTRYYEQGRQGFQVGATRSWKTDDFGFRLNIQGTSIGEREEVDVLFANALGTPTRRQNEFYQQQAKEILITGAANWTPTARDTFNANFRVLPRWFTNNAAADVRLPAGTPLAHITLDYAEKDIWYVDLGGDWEHKFDPQNAIKLITVNRLVNWRPQQELAQFPLFPAPTTGVRAVDNSDNRAGEHVVRGVWTTKPVPEHTIELGLEGAYNYRRVDRQSLQGFVNGPLVSVPIPVASTKVEEERVEASVTDVWRINPQWTLEAGVNFEASTISQTFTQPVAPEVERDFTYTKPRVVLSWVPGEDQWRFTLAKDVSQLDFGDFATGLDTISSSANVGNPNLEPEQVWKISGQWKRAIGKRGSISLTGFYDQIEDTQDFIAVATPGIRTAVGNIGDGERWGGRIEATFPLDDIGIKNGLLKINAGATDSKVTDPLTGEERRISKQVEYDWTIDFRQDIPEWKVAWGGNYSSIGANSEFRSERIETIDPGEGDLDLFVETTRFLGGALVRVTAANLFNPEREVDRRFYSPNRIPPGAFSGTEDRTSTFGRTLTLTVAGAF